MSRQQKLIGLPLVGAILLYLFALKRISKRGPAARIIKHPVETPADEALKYWTADKMRNAKPAKMPNIDASERGKKSPRRLPHPSRPSED